MLWGKQGSVIRMQIAGPSLRAEDKVTKGFAQNESRVSSCKYLYTFQVSFHRCKSWIPLNQQTFLFYRFCPVLRTKPVKELLVHRAASLREVTWGHWFEGGTCFYQRNTMFIQDFFLKFCPDSSAIHMSYSDHARLLRKAPRQRRMSRRIAADRRIERFCFCFWLPSLEYWALTFLGQM